MSALRDTVNYSNCNELDNIAINIEFKLKLLDIKLPKLAELADVDYFTLRKIINRDNDYMPNLRILKKLAEFFKINTGDLLKFNNLTQYIPIITLDQVEEFLTNEISDFELQHSVFSDTYIHEKGFSVKRKLKSFGINAQVDHVCYPTDKFFKDEIFIVRWNSTICFIQVNTIKNGIIYFNNDDSEYVLQDKVEYVTPLAIVVKFILNQSLI